MRPHCRGLLVCITLALAACPSVTDQGGVDSETHFLRHCDESCPGDLECICGVCSLTCSPARDCSAESPLASCVSAAQFAPSERCESAAQPSVCDVLCERDLDCTTLGDGYTCEHGSCRADAPDAAAPNAPPQPTVDAAAVDAATASRDAGATVSPDAGAPTVDSGSPVESSPPVPLDHCPDQGIERYVGEVANLCTCTEPGVIECYLIGYQGTCEVDGQTYEATRDVPSDDPCQRCRCGVDGTVECVALACPVCELDGSTVGPGTYPAGDGCNHCTCHEGEVSCTSFDCSTLEARCDLPFDPGPCDAVVPAYFHDPRTGQCEAVEWGGCEGNANRFDSLEACENACGDRPAHRACMAEREIVEHGQLAYDPHSCNACICDDGQLADCTQHDCAYQCPEGQQAGTTCPGCQADGDDACDVVGHGCFSPCTSDADCGGALSRCGASGLCEVGYLCP